MFPMHKESAPKTKLKIVAYGICQMVNNAGLSVSSFQLNQISKISQLLCVKK